MRWTRGRTFAVIGFMALAGAMFVVPAAFGTTDGQAVRLHFDDGGQEFSFGSQEQPLFPTRCGLGNPLTGTLMNVEVVGGSGNPQAGINSYGMGIKSGGAQGTPCGRAAVGEGSLVLTPGSLIATRSFAALRLDLELKGNARIELKVFGPNNYEDTFRLNSGTSIQPGDTLTDSDPSGGFDAISTSSAKSAACSANTSDSGPDSGASDNCLWRVEPDQEFNRIELRALIGEFSLEGSGDYGGDSDFDSLFILANAAPTANPDSATVGEDGPAVEILVLANDTDEEDSTSELTITTFGPVSTADADGAIGQVTVADDWKSLFFSPNGQFEHLQAGEERTNTFTYTVADSDGATAQATVTVTINGINDAPFFLTDENDDLVEVVTDEEAPLTVDLADDIDSENIAVTCAPDGQSATPKLDEEGNQAETEAGEPIYLLLDGSGNLVGEYVDHGDGSITFTPALDVNITDVEFKCEADDGTDSTTATIKFTVAPKNDDPVALDDPGTGEALLAVNAGGSIDIDVLANDSDVDGDALTISDPGTVPEGFDLSVVDVDGTSKIRLETPSSFVGSITFSYTIGDGNGGSDTADVTVYELFTCEETLDVPANDYGISGTYSRIVGEGCDDKPYVLEVVDTDDGPGEAPAILFQPFPTDGPAVEDCSLLDNGALNSACDDEFIAVLSFGAREPGNPSNTGELEYDPSDNGEYNWRTMQWCLQDPDVDGLERPSPDEILPGPVDPQEPDQGESWCIVSETTTVDGQGDTVTTWTIYGIGDPFKRLS